MPTRSAESHPAPRAPAAALGAGDSPRTERSWVRVLLIATALVYLGVIVGLPLAVIFAEAFGKGWHVYWQAISHRETGSAIWLTLLSAAIAVSLNLLFGVLAAWALTRFDFRGKTVLAALIDLPFAVSPVIGGMVFVLLYGARGWLGPWLIEHDIKIIFAKPGLVLATIFVTLPFVVRELVPLMNAQGAEPEEAAYSLGATGWQIFFRVTLPNIKWALLYGVILCNARAMGEFGAASVVSGSIRGQTVTLPLHIEILFNEYDAVGSFACASLLTITALATLALKAWAESGGRATGNRSHGPLASVAGARPGVSR